MAWNVVIGGGPDREHVDPWRVVVGPGEALEAASKFEYRPEEERQD